MDEELLTERAIRILDGPNVSTQLAKVRALEAELVQEKGFTQGGFPKVNELPMMLDHNLMPAMVHGLHVEPPVHFLKEISSFHNDVLTVRYFLISIFVD